MKLFNRLVCIALLFSIAMLPAIRVAMISLHKHKIARQLKKKLHLEHAETLWLKKSEIAAIKAEKEIYWFGNKYDVLAVADHGDYWCVTAINDKKEKQLEDLQEGSRNGVPNQEKPGIKVFVLDWIASFTFLPQPQNGQIQQLDYLVYVQLSLGSRTQVFRPLILG